MREKMHPLDIMADYKPGDRWDREPGDTLPNGWGTEWRLLWTFRGRKMRRLTLSALLFGIRKPILLGSDGRVWDGHHRLLAAHAAGRRVPFKVVR